MATFLDPTPDSNLTILTQSAYDALPIKEPDRTYLIKKAGNEPVPGDLQYVIGTYKGTSLVWKDSRLLPAGSWFARTSAANNGWSSVCWSPQLSLFVAVATSGTGNRVMTSPDGITWTARTSAADNIWYGVCWSPELSLFVAVAASGTGNRVMTSPDGITWTAKTSAADNEWLSVCWSPELSLFVAVASSGTGNRVMTSA